MEIAVFIFFFLDYCVKQMKLYGANSADETKLLVGAFHFVRVLIKNGQTQ